MSDSPYFKVSPLQQSTPPLTPPIHPAVIPAVEKRRARILLDSRFRGKDEIEQVSVIPAKAGIQKNGTVEDFPRFLEKIPMFSLFIC